MLDFLQSTGKADARRCHHFACACLWRVWDRVADDALHHLLEVVESYADGRIGPGEVADAWKGILSPPLGNLYTSRLLVGMIPAPRLRTDRFATTWAECRMVAQRAARAIFCWANDTHAALNAEVGREVQAARGAWWSAWSVEDAERAAQACLLRCIFRHPSLQSRPFELSWRTPEVVTLAAHVSTGRAFDRVSELVRLLEAAGCSDAFLLDHLGGITLHTRGCWALDAILNRVSPWA